MSIGINNLNSYSARGIDTSNVSQVSKEIFERSNAKTVDLNKADLSGFKRIDNGIDLYSQRTSIDQQRQISMTNAGLNLDVQASASTVYLNSQAASMNYANNIHKNVEGKMAFALNEGETISMKEVFSLTNSPELNPSKTLDKDKRGSNPFSFYQPSKSNTEKEKNESLSIFA